MPTQFNTLCQESTLYEAWSIVKSKGSAGGVDGVTIEVFNKVVLAFKKWKTKAKNVSSDFMDKLLGHEAQTAIHYWAYIRELISDDDVGFERREHQGATDLVNSMLNYGYAILYVRIWQALLAAKLNPFNSLIHARQEGKPTLAYDMVEIFRSQVVDRIVISLIQKGQNLEVRKGLLTDKTRQLLVKSVMERLARMEYIPPVKKKEPVKIVVV